MAVRRNHQVVARRPVIPVHSHRQPNMSSQHLQGRFARALVLTQFVARDHRDHRLPQEMAVAAVHSVRRPPTVRLAGHLELFLDDRTQ